MAKSFTKKKYSNSLGRGVRSEPEALRTASASGLVLNHTKANTAKINTQITEKKKKNATTQALAYKQKLTIYGNTYEIITYNKTQFKNDCSTRYDYTKKSNTTRRNDSLWRTRNSVCRLIIANVDTQPLFKPVFVTLTFAKNITDIKTANRHYKYFCTKLSDYLGYRPLYITVVEFQKRGAIHYHSVYFNLPFINKDVFENIWQHGYSQIRVVDQIKNVSRYVGKYMSKQLIDKRLVGQKAYFTSRGLSRPVSYYKQENIDRLLNHATLTLQETINNPDYTIKKYRL